MRTSALRTGSQPRLRSGSSSPIRSTHGTASTGSSGGRSRAAPSRPRRASARRAGVFGLPAEGPVVLVCGGSQGARTLNEAAIEAFGDGGPGRAAPDRRARLRRALDSRSSGPATGCFAFTDEFGSALAAADLVVSRSGGVVWEIAAAGKPALARSLSARHRRPPDEERTVLRGRRWRRSSFKRRSSTCARRCRRSWPTPTGSRGWRRRCAAALVPNAAETVAEELLALAAARR